MLKRLVFSILITSSVFTSCKSDDEYQSVPISTFEDTVQVLQNSQVEIPIFSNDLNIPASGTLSLSTPAKGSVSILDNNLTPQDISDDVLLYIPSPNTIGEETFEYTICEDVNTCFTETVTITIISNSTVNYNLETIPYPTLSAYNFFSGLLKNLNPTFGVLPYDLNSPLFSDYAKKKRFIWMPPNVNATYNEDSNPLEFPLGSILIKNFYFENILPENSTKILETRLMIKKENNWEFAKYVWNEDQTEAVLTSEGSFVSFDWIEGTETKSVNYRIPSQAECFTCHNKFGTPLPIGPKPQNLNKNFSYVDGISNQLEKWISQGYLQDNIPSSIVSTVDWKDEALPLDLRARSYIDINCAHCHSDESYCEYRPMRFAFGQNGDDTNMGICVSPDIQVEPYTKIIQPQNINVSLLHFRMSTTEEQYRMPLLGRTLKHEEGVRLIEQWINSLNTECQ